MRLKNRYVAVLAVFTLFIAGCSNSLVGRMSGAGVAESTVTFSVTDIPADYNAMIAQAKNPTSRTILPNAPFTTTAGLTFILSGISNIGSSFSEVVTISGTGTYTFNKALSAHVWDLTLTAYKEYNPSDAHHKPVLVGHCMVDVTHSNGTASFNMSTKGLTTPATVKLTGSVPDPLHICAKYKAGIYDAYSGRLIDEYKDVNGSAQASNAEQERTVTSPGDPCPFHYGDTSAGDLEVKINPGAYTFTIVFYKADGQAIGSWADDIVVYPGNDLERTVNVPDVLMKKPRDPTHLRAYLVKGGDGVEGNYYLTKLTWDSSMFEINYELELSTSTDDGTTFSSPPEVYGFNMTNLSATNFAGSSIRYGGSLISGSHECTLKLELGKVYEVKLRARNYVGESNWLERTASSAPTTPADCTFIDIPTSAEPHKHINRRRIRYNLNGGTLKHDIGTPSEETETGTYVVYDSYQGTAKDLLKIEKSLSPTTPPTHTPPTSGNSLTKAVSTPPGILDFAGWLNSNTRIEVSPDHTISPMPAGHADFYKHINVDLTANFGNALDGTVTMPGPLTEIPANRFKITYDKDNGTTHYTPQMDNGHFVIPRYVGTDISFITVKLDNLATPGEYKNMQCEGYFTSGSGFSKVLFNSAADGKSCTFSTGSYPTQRFTLLVRAFDSSNHPFSRTFLIDLQN